MRMFNKEDSPTSKHEEVNDLHDESFTSGSMDIEPKKKKKSKFKTYIALVLASSIISSAAVGGALYSGFSGQLERQTELVQKAVGVTDKVSGTTNSIGLNVEKTALAKGSAVTDIAKKVGPSVVGIQISFGKKQLDDGSGVIISQDGYIMTNYHVVSNIDPKSRNSTAYTATVFLPDNRQVIAKFIGGDSKNDLAVIKVDLTNLPAAELGDSSQLEVGELAVAIGNPLGMDFAGSVTVGVVSAINRNVDIIGNGKTLNLIQTDAAINPGNSGGALVNSQGQVVGINTAKISVSGVEGLGFAIPISIAKPIIDQLIMFGYIKGRPLLGISGQEVTDQIAAWYNLPVGVFVTKVQAGTGAETAGIKKGDVIVKLAGSDVKTMQDLDTVKEKYKAGDTVDVVVVRKGSTITLKLTFSEDK
jgi:serine protease Do